MSLLETKVILAPTLKSADFEQELTGNISTTLQGNMAAVQVDYTDSGSLAGKIELYARVDKSMQWILLSESAIDTAKPGVLFNVFNQAYPYIKVVGNLSAGSGIFTIAFALKV
jgi:hypothetical protein